MTGPGIPVHLSPLTPAWFAVHVITRYRTFACIDGEVPLSWGPPCTSWKWGLGALVDGVEGIC